jgi:sugar phosphate isomerase/epimerase
MRLGASWAPPCIDPEKIARAHRQAGYNAAICPEVSLGQTDHIRAIRQAFAKHDVMLAEIGVWNNMLDPDDRIRRRNLAENVQRLAIAESVGVRCCVNIAGSVNPASWHGPFREDLSEAAFEQTVANIRHIIDSVQPTRAYYAIEPMPWGIPDSPESALRLVLAVDRPMFAVHRDPVNMINSPSHYYHNANRLRDCFRLPGKWIVSVHAKDILLHNTLTVHPEEKRPGLGDLDYAVFLSELNRLPGDIPLIIEHLPNAEYPPARDHLLKVAASLRLSFGDLHPPPPAGNRAN